MWKFSSFETLQLKTILGALVGFLTVFIFSYFLNQPVEEVPLFISDEGYGITFPLVVGMILNAILIAFYFSFTSSNFFTIKNSTHWTTKFFFRLATSVVLSLVMVVVSIMIAVVLNQSFEGGILNNVFAGIVPGVIVGFSNFLLARYIIGLDLMGLAHAQVFLMVVGVVGAMLLTHDPEWWKNSVSYLGYESYSSSEFEFTFIVVGLLINLIAFESYYALKSLVEGSAQLLLRLRAVAIIIFLCGIAVIAIGVFRVQINDLFSQIHNFSAQSVGTTLQLLALSIWFFIPNLAKTFKVVSVVIGVFAVLNVIGHYLLGTHNFVIMELVMLITFTVWAFLFVESVNEVAIEQQEAASA